VSVSMCVWVSRIESVTMCEWLIFHDQVDTHLCMQWLRLVGFSKLQVSFAKEPYKKDNILQKRRIILRSLLTVATPYIESCHELWAHQSVPAHCNRHSSQCKAVTTIHMTHSYVCDNALQHTATGELATCHESFIFVAWLINRGYMTHEYVWWDTCVHVTWLAHVCDMTQSYEGHHSFMPLHNSCIHTCDVLVHTCAMYTCDVTRAWVWLMTQPYLRYDSVNHIRDITYGVATVSRIDNITGLFCRILSL